jgi:hypothetical protein
VKGLAVAAGALASMVLAAGCGSGGSSAATSSAASGKGIGDGLRAAGLSLCVGPLSGESGSASGSQSGAVSLTVYAERGFAAVVASGEAATQDAINLAALRNHVQSSVSAADVAATERAWRLQALSALANSAAPRGPCRSGLQHLPVLGATEVVCSDQVLIPLGHRWATTRFVDLLSKLVNVKITPEQFLYLRQGQYLTVPESVSESRPYCQGS